MRYLVLSPCQLNYKSTKPELYIILISCTTRGIYVLDIKIKSEDALKTALDQSIHWAFASERLVPRHSSVPTLNTEVHKNLWIKKKSFVPVTNPLAGKTKHSYETIKHLQKQKIMKTALGHNSGSKTHQLVKRAGPHSLQREMRALSWMLAEAFFGSKIP